MTTALMARPSAPTTLGFDANILAGQLAASSIKMYQRDFNAYLQFAGSVEAALDPATLGVWRGHLAEHTEMSPNTINRMLAAVKRLMSEAAERNFITRELADKFGEKRGVKVAALRSRLRIQERVELSPEDLRRLVDAPNPNTYVGKRDRALLHTLASSGGRVTEIATLRLDQIRQVGAFYQIALQGKNAILFDRAPLSVEAYQAITSWLEARTEQSDYIFTQADECHRESGHEHINSWAVWQRVQHYAQRVLGRHLSTHDLRRAFGTLITDQHGIAQAREGLRHVKLETTIKYQMKRVKPGLTDGLY